LDGVYRRHVRYFRGEEEDLVYSVSSVFTGLLGHMDLSRVRRVASTLVRSTRREVMVDLQRKWDEEDRHRPFTGTSPALPLPCRGPAAQSGLSFEGELRSLREWLLPVVGPDADLLLGVVILGENQREAGERMGLPHDVARKRIWRAMDRVRKFLDTDLSQFEGSTRVSVGETAERPGGVD
jgi:RNA polymerase sigma-70 factor (ECF subfamily)